MSGYRLSAGGRIDRTKPLRFSLDGVPLQGYQGDTLASALIAAGVAITGRSPRLGRPRGIYGAGREEPNAILAVESADRLEFARATEVDLENGLVARALAGKAPVPVAEERLHEHIHTHTDVLVVGAGPAGLAAARAACRTGCRVMLVDDQTELGGSLLGAQRTLDGRPALEWVSDVQRELSSRPHVTVLSRAVVLGLYHANLALIRQRPPPDSSTTAGFRRRQLLWHVRARRVVVATGAIERPVVFRDNDRPGIMLAGGARTYLNRFGVAVGHAAVVFTNNDSAYPVAREMAEAGVTVRAVIDFRNRRPWASRQIATAGIELLPGHAVVGTNGVDSLECIEIAPVDNSGIFDPRGDGRRRIECDVLVTSGGWNPALELFGQVGGGVRWERRLATFVPRNSVRHVQVAGAAAGAFNLADALATGAAAGAGAADDRMCHAPALACDKSDDEDEMRSQPRAVWLVSEPRNGGDPAPGDERRFVDLQRDATVADIAEAVAAGMQHPEHIKRYTTIGTGNDQGRTSSVNAVGALAMLTGQSLARLAPTTSRPPASPIPFELLAGPYRGELFDPIRETPIHPSHVALGASFEDAGQWKRPEAYRQPKETRQEAVSRECRAVRHGVGISDISTLGKVDIQGPDAGVFLDRLYVNRYLTLKVGETRYGIMCRSDGMVLDDGTTTRLDDTRYHMTTTTGNATHVLEWLEEWLQTEWPDLQVRCTSVTEHWAAIVIAGPRSRDLLHRLSPDLDLRPAAFPFMTFRRSEVAGIPARLFRVSFSGELAYEVNVSSKWGRSLWDAAMNAGRDLNIEPYGMEAMRVLRAEKGFVIVGQDTDGTVTPLDLGLDLSAMQRKWFIGRRSLSRVALQKPDRRQLVGLVPSDSHEPLTEGSALVDVDAAGQPAEGTSGHITSSYYSSTLGFPIALGLLTSGRQRIGTIVRAQSHTGQRHDVKVTEPVFYDPQNARRDRSAREEDLLAGQSLAQPRGGGSDVAPSYCPVRRSPLGNTTPDRSVIAASVDVTVWELPFRSQLNMRISIDDRSSRETCRWLGVNLPLTPNRVKGSSALRALWLGPDEWLLVSDDGDPGDLERRVRARASPLGGTIVDVSSQRTVIEIRGPRTRDLLARGCSLDLHPAVFRRGDCAQTTLARVDVILECIARNAFVLFVPTSFARYTAQWLASALSLMAVEAPATGPRARRRGQR